MFLDFLPENALVDDHRNSRIRVNDRISLKVITSNDLFDYIYFSAALVELKSSLVYLL